FFSSRRRHTRSKRDWSSDVCSSDLHHLPLSSWTISSHTHWSELSRTAVVKSRSFRLPLKVNLKWIGHFQIEHHERAEIPLTNLQSLSVLFLPHSHQK